MAIWQITFYIIDASVSNINLDQDTDFDDSYYWENSKRDVRLFKSVGLFLEENKSWSSQIKQYGDLKSNCLEVYFDDTNKILSVSFRIDFLSDYDLILEKVLIFCLNNNLAIVTLKGDVLPLQLNFFKFYISKYIKENGIEIK